MAEAPLLELRGITKRFPGVLANDNINFDLRHGEVHALLGENGAGKSTLMNILYGLYTPDEGEILLNGKPIDLGSTKAAIEHGIGMVHQHFMLIPVMTVAENIVLAIEPRHGGVLLDYDAARKRVRELSERYGLAVNPDARIDRISVGQQQRVEILKALYRGAEILILDEPTAVLTPQEARELFEILESLKSQGKSIIFITHKLNEVLEVADRITTLRRGKAVDTVSAEGATEEGLARMMVGREVLLRVDKPPATPGEPLLSVENLSVVDDRGLEVVRDVSFEVRAGEILGLAGVDANGQSELIDAIAGLRSPASGRIVVDGHDVTHANARQSLDAGIGHIPEDRHRRGLVLPFSLTENLALHDYRRAAELAQGFPPPGEDARARAAAPARVRRPRRHADDAGVCALGRQPAEGRARARDRRQPEGPDRGPADTRPRRRRDRVRAPQARRAARQRPGGLPGVARARRGALALRPHPRHLRGTDRR